MQSLVSASSSPVFDPEGHSVLYQKMCNSASYFKTVSTRKARNLHPCRVATQMMGNSFNGRERVKGFLNENFPMIYHPGCI